MDYRILRSNKQYPIPFDNAMDVDPELDHNSSEIENFRILRSKKKYPMLCDDAMDVCDNTYELDLDDMPVEVLQMIFDRLPFRSRSNAKLVCRKWYDVLTAWRYRSREKFVCRRFYRVAQIMKTLSEFKSELVHLEFQNIYFNADQYDVNFWLARGSQINELRFTNCIVDERTFLRIVEHCVNLKHLHWKSNNEERICSNQTLDRLIKLRISLKTLLTFETHVVDLSMYIRFLLVFPKLKRYAFSYQPSTPFEADDQLRIKNKELRNVTALTDVMRTCANVENLSWKFRNLSTAYMQKMFASAYNPINLQAMEFTVVTRLLPEKEFLSFISRQTNLKSMKFTDILTGLEENDIGDKILRTLFQHCRELRSLHMNLGSNLNIDSALLMKMKSSNLQNLFIRCPSLRFGTLKEMNVDVVNHTLRSLCLNANMRAQDYSFVANSFTRLDHLELNWFSSNMILKSIATCQTQLRSLRFEAGTLRPSKRDTREKRSHGSAQFYHLSKLKNLQFLYMRFRELQKYKLQEKMLAKFKLVNLEFLHVDVSGDDEFNEAWLKALSRSRKLQGLFFIARKKVSFESWLRFCSSMKSLEFLKISSGEQRAKSVPRYTKEEIDEFFKSCPSLRVLVLHQATSFYDVYYCNSVTKEILKARHGDPPFVFTSSKLNDYFVDWMKF